MFSCTLKEVKKNSNFIIKLTVLRYFIKVIKKKDRSWLTSTGEKCNPQVIILTVTDIT